MALLSFSQVAVLGGVVVVAAIIINLIKQTWFANKNEPPVVFHWVPFVGSTITYGMEPYKFMAACRAKYGDIFTFVLLGRKTTVYLGTAGNEFILNAKEKDVNAEEIYGPLCNPVFGKDVVYDCPNAKLMEQKKFIKYGLSQDALVSMVSLIEQETLDYINKNSAKFKSQSGVVNITEAMAQITIFTAGGALQGPEVRAKLTDDFAALFHDLEKGFTPINFMMPWFPLPQNRIRDRAHQKMKAIYMDIIQKRRAGKDDKQDMIWNLMRSVYKNGTPMPDAEAACIMLTLLMAGQHNSANISAWTLLRLSDQPEITEKLYQEQLENLGRNGDGSIAALTYDDLDRLPLHNNVVKETLRLHNGIHSILRQVKNDMPIPGTNYVIPKGHVVLAAPGVSAREEKYFPDPLTWNPYRWENVAEEKEEESDMVDYGYGRVSKGTKSPYLPFGAGRHRCIGEKFAYVNLVVIIATMVRHFKFQNMPGVKGVPKTDYSTLFSCPLQPTLVKWERRTPL